MQGLETILADATQSIIKMRCNASSVGAEAVSLVATISEHGQHQYFAPTNKLALRIGKDISSYVTVSLKCRIHQKLQGLSGAVSKFMHLVDYPSN